jgi:hypothetical protein
MSCEILNVSWDSSVGIATGYGQEFSLLHVFQTGSGAHPASYSVSTGGAFPGGKAARA